MKKIIIFSSEHERRGGHTGRKFISKIFHSDVSFVYKSKEPAANQIIPNVMNNDISISNYYCVINQVLCFSIFWVLQDIPEC